MGAVLWIASLVYAGYIFGNIPWVKQNLSLIVVGIVVVSLLPGRAHILVRTPGGQEGRE